MKAMSKTRRKDKTEKRFRKKQDFEKNRRKKKEIRRFIKKNTGVVSVEELAEELEDFEEYEPE